jgi:glutamyl/glutaminyl-tRNA synthetase
MNQKRKVGRPIKYDFDEVLKPELIRIAKDCQMGILTPTLLAANSDIPYWVWRDNKDVKKSLESINKKRSIISFSTKAIKEFPNLAAAIDNNYYNKQKVLSIANDYMYLVNELVEYIEKLEEKNNSYASLKEEYEALKRELRNSRENEMYYMRRLDEIMINSKLKQNRDKLGIKENQIDLVLQKEKAGKIGKKLIEIFDEIEK